MSHRTSVRLVYVLPALMVVLCIAAPSAAVQPVVNERLAETPEVRITIDRTAAGDEVDVQPRSVIVCEGVKVDCSNEIVWVLINNSTDLGPDDGIELVYKPIPPEPYIPKIFTEQAANGDLSFEPGSQALERMVRPKEDWEGPLGNPKFVVWRYEVKLIRDGEVVATIDPRIIVDRTR